LQEQVPPIKLWISPSLGQQECWLFYWRFLSNRGRVHSVPFIDGQLLSPQTVSLGRCLSIKVSENFQKLNYQQKTNSNLDTPKNGITAISN
jgi:uncharacterized metal-binding protein